jgi:inorganic pyrophosphatase
MENTYSVYIEIEKHSRIKYEYNKTIHKLEVDRILPYPYFYPHAYGYFPNTLTEDGDELDILILTSDDEEPSITKNRYYDVEIVGGLIMEDEKGLDEKIFTIKKGDPFFYNLNENKRNELFYNIMWFFSNYKSLEPNKWSSVKGLIDKEDAIALYNKYKLPVAICLLTRYYNQDWIDFLKTFSDHYDIYMVIDDNSKNPSFDNMVDNENNKIKLVQIEDKLCYESNYCKSSISSNLKDLVAWDRALYYFNRVCQKKYRNIWFIEDDVFLCSEKMLLNIDTRYSNSDLLSSFHEINETGNIREGWNHWVNVVNRIGTPWAHSLVCICRLSSRLLDRVDEYIQDRHLLFIEALFNTLCLHNGYKVDNPEEISDKSIHFNKKWTMDDIHKGKIYHPIKEVYLHSYIRHQLQIENEK